MTTTENGVVSHKLQAGVGKVGGARNGHVAFRFHDGERRVVRHKANLETVGCELNVVNPASGKVELREKYVSWPR